MQSKIFIQILLFTIINSNIYSQNFPYDFFEGFHNNFSVIKKNTVYGFIDKKGNEIVEPRYQYLSFIENNFAVFRDNNQNYGIINKEGVVTYKANLEVLWPPFNTDIFVAKKNGKWGYINHFGKIIIPFIYDGVTSFESHSNLALVYKGNYPNCKYGFIDKKGNTIIPLKYSNANLFRNGFAWVNENGNSYYINKMGKPFFKNFKFDYDYNGFNDNRSAFKLNNKFGFIDTNGVVKIAAKFDEIRNFEEGEKICQVKVDGKWGAININGEYILKPVYDYVSSFKEKIGYCIKDGKYFVINNLGYLINNESYDDCKSHQNGVIAVKKNEKWGFINNLGSVVIPLEYDEADSFKEELTMVKKNGIYKIINKNNECVLYCK